jgi:hypothetical protein
MADQTRKDRANPAGESRRTRKLIDVLRDLWRMSNMAAATGTEEIRERVDFLCIEWLVVRGLEVHIRQDHSGNAVEVAKSA